VAVLVTLSLGMSACGDAGGGKTVATVGRAKVSQTTLDHWMGFMLGSDYVLAIRQRPPDGLVSDPPNYGRCVSMATRLVPEVAGKPKLTTAQVQVKCHQLYAAIKEQALNYILGTLWVRAQVAELRLPIPDESDVTAHLRAVAYADYKSLANYRKLAAEQRHSAGDIRFLAISDLLQDEVSAHIQARATQLGGGEKTFYRLVLQSNARWRAKTNCDPGYRAMECKQYGSAGEATPAGTAALELLHKGVESSADLRSASPDSAPPNS
jgi:hypothetical protein